jgi:Domain of unknown function (DUF4371)
LNRVLAARYFSVLADETTDASRAEIMTFCVRYVDENKKIREDFLKVDDVTADGPSQTILQYIPRHQMNVHYLVGQGYDGASAMSGRH